MRLAGLLVCMVLLWFGDLLATLTWPLRALLAVVWRWRTGDGRWFDRERAVLRLIDHKVNVAWFGGHWWASLSAQSWQAKRQWLVRALDVIEDGHCRKAFEGESDVFNFFKGREQ